MARDYKHTQRAPERTPQPLMGGIVIGLLLGLLVAAGVHIYHRGLATEAAKRDVAVTTTVPAPAPKPVAKPKPENPETPFEFYDRLRTLEVVIPENERQVSRLPPPTKKGEKAPIYMLQAGSFRNVADAERVRAKLALQGVEANIQKVTIDNDIWHRVRVGPISDPDQLVRTRNKLKTANIDSLVLLLGE
jgi:cell division protein FtsN